MLEIFGPSTLLIPWLFVRIALHYPRKFSFIIGCYYAFVIVFILSILHQIALNYGIFKENNSEFFLQNGYAGRLGVIWIDHSTNINIGLFALVSMLVFAIVRMHHILSPLPFLIGIYFTLKKLLKIFSVKSFSIKSTDEKNKKNLPNFKVNYLSSEDD